MTPSLPPDAETQDPAAIEFRNAWEQALQNADATDQGQDYMNGTQQVPVLEVGGTPETAPNVPVENGAVAQPAAGLSQQPSLLQETMDQEASGVGGSGTQSTQSTSGTPETPQSSASTGNQTSSAGNERQELERLRAQVQSLQSQLSAQQEETAADVETLQGQLTGMQERATQLEQMREQRLSELDRAHSWLVAADQALRVGQLDIGDALSEADSALSRASQSSISAGNGRTVSLIQTARDQIYRAMEATGRRDTGPARDYLFVADWFLQQARRQNLDAPSAALVAH